MSRRLLLLLLAISLVVAACGDGDVATTTTTTTAATTSTATTTTVAPSTTVDTGPLAGFLAAPVQDTLLGTGYHQMQYGDEFGSYVVSVDSLTGSGEADRLALAVLEPFPETTGVAADQMLVGAWVDNWTGDIAPTAIVLYTLGAEGWTAYVTITDAAVLGFLETTTDYQARMPDGPAIARTALNTFAWSGGSAQFTGLVTVLDYVADYDQVFGGEIECVLSGALECLLVSDDGVLRPGDEGDDVTALQEGLIPLGYFSAPATGVYDEATADGVREFQRDYRLTRDGKAGPQTLGLLAKVLDGTSGIILASQFGIGWVLMNTNAPQAMTNLQTIFGAPDGDTGWYADACDGHQWRILSWGGFNAILTDREGSARLDGWEVTDLAAVPSFLYFKGGFRPGTTWGYVKNLPGAGWDPDYGGFFWVNGYAYNDGRLVVTPPYPADPADSAVVREFGTGTGAFVSC